MHGNLAPFINASGFDYDPTEAGGAASDLLTIRRLAGYFNPQLSHLAI